MALPKQHWSPLCAKYLSVGRLQDAETDLDETHLTFQTQDGAHFVLKVSSTEVTKLWEGLSLLLQAPSFPSRPESDETH